MRTPFERRKAERLAREFDAGSLMSSEARAAGLVRGAFYRDAWPEKQTWQRIYEQALAGEDIEQPMARGRSARRAGTRVTYVAVAVLTVVAAAGYLLLSSQSRVGRQLPPSSGTAVAHEMLSELRRPGTVTHYVVERSVSGLPGPYVRHIDSWIDGEKGIVKSTGSVAGRFNGRWAEAATRVTTVERGGRATIITQEPGRPADVEITNNFFVPPASLLSDPMRGGVSRYEQLLRRGGLTLVGAETVRGVATYKLRSEFAGVSLFNEVHATTVINARQDNFQPVIITSAVEQVPIRATYSAGPFRSRVVTRYVRTEVLDRGSLPADFFEVRTPPRAAVRSEIGYSTEEAQRFEPYPVYYAGASFEGMPLQALAELAGQAVMPGGASRNFVVLYQSKRQRMFVNSVPGAVDLRRLIDLEGGAESEVTTVRLTKGALRGRTALLQRRTPGSAIGGADIYIAAPGCTVRIQGGSPAQVVAAANSLQKLN